MSDIEDDIKYARAKRYPDGKLFEATLKIGGKSYRCDCGCNVFHVPDFEKPNVYRCNACGFTFETE